MAGDKSLCGCCGNELKLGLFERIFKFISRDDYDFKNCHDCRAMYLSGYSVEEIRSA